MNSLVVVIDSADENSRRLEFDRSPVRIGRGIDNEVRLPLGFVSDRHAQIDFDETTAMYVDLGSTNGTIVAGNRLKPHVPIPIEGTLRVELGPVRLEFQRKDLAAAQGRQTARGQASPTPPPPKPDMVDTAAAPPTLNDEFPLITPPEVALEAPFEPAQRAAAGVIGERREAFSNGLPTIYPMDPGTGSAAIAKAPAVSPPTQKSTPRPAREKPGGFPPWPIAPVATVAPAAPVVPAPAAAPVAPGPVRRPTGGDESAEVAALKRLAATMCEELIRLRDAHDVLGREMGIRTFTESERSRLHDFREAAEMLRYLTTPTADRQKELRALFADMGAHHLAMMSALVEGARATLAHVDPGHFRGGRKSLLGLGRSQNRWDEYVEQFHAFAEDEHAVQAAMFGPEFAEAYAAKKGD